jgi:hypothetical protein
MADSLRPETVRSWVREAQDLDITPERAAAIAKLIDPVATIARTAARSVTFDSEPGDFLRALRRWAGERK